MISHCSFPPQSQLSVEHHFCTPTEWMLVTVKLRMIDLRLPLLYCLSSFFLPPLRSPSIQTASPLSHVHLPPIDFSCMHLQKEGQGKRFISAHISAGLSSLFSVGGDLFFFLTVPKTLPFYCKLLFIYYYHIILIINNSLHAYFF